MTTDVQEVIARTLRAVRRLAQCDPIFSILGSNHADSGILLRERTVVHRYEPRAVRLGDAQMRIKNLLLRRRESHTNHLRTEPLSFFEIHLVTVLILARRIAVNRHAQWNTLRLAGVSFFLIRLLQQRIGRHIEKTHIRDAGGGHCTKCIFANTRTVSDFEFCGELFLFRCTHADDFDPRLVKQQRACVIEPCAFDNDFNFRSSLRSRRHHGGHAGRPRTRNSDNKNDRCESGFSFHGRRDDDLGSNTSDC